jgi:hypothetical protein
MYQIDCSLFPEALPYPTTARLGDFSPEVYRPSFSHGKWKVMLMMPLVSGPQKLSGVKIPSDFRISSGSEQGDSGPLAKFASLERNTFTSKLTLTSKNANH